MSNTSTMSPYPQVDKKLLQVSSYMQPTMGEIEVTEQSKEQQFGKNRAAASLDRIELHQAVLHLKDSHHHHGHARVHDSHLQSFFFFFSPNIISPFHFIFYPYLSYLPIYSYSQFPPSFFSPISFPRTPVSYFFTIYFYKILEFLE